MFLGLAGCGEARFETTTLPRIAGRQKVTYRCTADLRSGRTTVERPSSLDAVEGDIWKSQGTQGMKEGRLYKVVLETTPADSGFRKRTRFLLRETEGSTGHLLRTIPIQEFQGEYDESGARAVGFKEGSIRFLAEFWVND